MTELSDYRRIVEAPQIASYEATICELQAVLAEMVERERRRYENTEAGQKYFRMNNADALRVLGMQ